MNLPDIPMNWQQTGVSAAEPDGETEARAGWGCQWFILPHPNMDVAPEFAPERQRRQAPPCSRVRVSNTEGGPESIVG